MARTSSGERTFSSAARRDLAQTEQAKAQLVYDYVAGMTDRFAIEEHRKLFHTDLWDRM